MAIPSAAIKETDSFGRNKKIERGCQKGKTSSLDFLSSVCKVKIPEFFIYAFLCVPDFWQNIRLPFECRIQRKAHF
jgi:hypothetical protein